MALVSDGYELSVNLKDNGSNVSTKRYYLTSATFAEAVTDTATILAALNAVTDAHISGYRLAEKYIEDAYSAPGSGVNVENIAEVVGLISGESDKYARFEIPAPEAGIFVAASGKGANTVDIGDANVLAYAALFQTDGECTLSDGEVLGTLTAGKRIHRKSTKG
jgi:hypothetical protein